MPSEPNTAALRVTGADELAAKHSAVDRRGDLRGSLIDGLRFRPTRPVPHEDGYLSEVARSSWDVLDAPIVQVHVTTTFAGRVRAWGLHRRITDRLFVVSGLVQIAVFDGREDSPTAGTLNTLVIGEKNPGLLVVPPNLYHGWKNIGVGEAVIINMPDVMYDYDAPDALSLAWDSEAARRIIPAVW